VTGCRRGTTLKECFNNATPQSVRASNAPIECLRRSPLISKELPRRARREIFTSRLSWSTALSCERFTPSSPRAPRELHNGQGRKRYGARVCTALNILCIYALSIRYSLTFIKKTPWSESASELYRPSDRRLSAKWLPTFADRGCHVEHSLTASLNNWKEVHRRNKQFVYRFVIATELRYRSTQFKSRLLHRHPWFIFFSVFPEKFRVYIWVRLEPLFKWITSDLSFNCRSWQRHK
jgi:hypothetical protein